MLNGQKKYGTKNSLIYYIFVILLALLEFLSIYSSAHGISLQTYTIVLAGFMGVLGIVTFFTSGISIRKILFLIILLIIYWSSKFNNFWVVPICITIAFVNFNLYDLINAYCISNIFTLILTAFLSIIGVSPIRNPADGVLSLGFATESALGLVITLISFIFVLKLIKYGRNTKYYSLKLLFIVVGILLKIAILEDRTMTWDFFVFLGFTAIFKLNKKIIIPVMKVLGIIIPYVLTYLSWNFTVNFGTSNLLYKLDQLLSYRLLMWNWYYQRVPILLFPNPYRLSDFNYWGTIDGSYTLLLLQYGVVMTLLVCTMLVVCNLLLLKYRYWNIFCMMISLELAAFVENILQFYTGAICLVFILLVLYKGWLKNSSIEAFRENNL